MSKTELAKQKDQVIRTIALIEEEGKNEEGTITGAFGIPNADKVQEQVRTAIMSGNSKSDVVTKFLETDDSENLTQLIGKIYLLGSTQSSFSAKLKSVESKLAEFLKDE